MAAGLLGHKITQLNQSAEWAIASAGTLATNGIPATEFAQTIMAEKKVNLKNHRSRVVTAALLESASAILTMTQNHREALRAEFPACAGKIHLVSELIDQEFDVTDPVTGTLADYRACANDLQMMIDQGWERLRAWTE